MQFFSTQIETLAVLCEAKTKKCNGTCHSTHDMGKHAIKKTRS